MKKIIFSILALLASNSFSQTYTIVEGKITNPKGTQANVTLEGYLPNQETLKYDGKLDKKGNFKIKFQLSSPMEASFGHGDEVTAIFLEPGDSIFLTLDTKLFDETVKYSGKGSENCNFLAKELLRAESLPDPGESIANLTANAEAKRFIQYSDSLKETDLKLLASQKNQLSPKFYSNRKYNILYKNLSEKIRYPFLHAYRNQLKNYNPGDSYYSFLENVTALNDTAINVSEYREFIDDYLNHYIRKLIASTTREYDNYYYTKYSIAKLFYKGESLKYLLSKVVNESIQYEKIEISKELLKDFIKESQNKERNLFLQAKWDKKLEISAGKPAPSFTLKNLEGKTVSLSDYKGKIVYLDFWASWCGPCMREMPHTKKLKENFKGKDVAFLYISIDEDENAWRKTVKEKQIEGVHLLSKGFKAETPVSYQIEGIPRYFIIGRDGKIIDNNATRPSEEKTVNALEAALKEGATEKVSGSN